jgi:ribonuclease D
MEIRYISDSQGLHAVAAALDGATRIALDSEAAGYHRYSDRICLLQLTSGSVTFLIDPLAIDPSSVLRPILENPAVETLMHGADYDIRLLGRDLGIGVKGIVDTQILAAFLGISALGLAALLEARLGIQLSKKYQKADWAQRPLTAPMLEYAALDTIHLPALADLLLDELKEKGRLEWADEEFRALELVRFDASASDQDTVLRIKGARELEPRQVARLRAALLWRDEIAREMDRAHFRVAGDQVLIEVARASPKSLTELEGISGMGQNLARQHGEELLRRFHDLDQLPDAEIMGWPRLPRTRIGPGWARRTPEIEDRFNRLKEIRNARAVALGIDRGVLLSNGLIQAIAEAPPTNLDALRNLAGVRRWQVSVVGEELLKAL